VVSGKSAARIKSTKFKQQIKDKQSVAGKQKTYEPEEEIKKLNIIIKADVQGSLEAIEQILSTIKSEEAMINYIHAQVGNITESDVKLAASSKGVIVGFNIEITPVAKRLAEASKVEIKKFTVIYDLVKNVKKSLSDLIPPEIIRIDLGKLTVLAIFKKGKGDMIVGGRITQGKMEKGARIEVKRNDEIIGNGKIVNLQQNKVNAEEVNQGNECGITFEGNVKIKEGDTLIAYKEEEKRKTL